MRRTLFVTEIYSKGENNRMFLTVIKSCSIIHRNYQNGHANEDIIKFNGTLPNF